jgi:hypothetical protein
MILRACVVALPRWQPPVRRADMRIAAGAISVLLGIGFGLPCLFGIIHFRRTGAVWTFMGFPTYGGGPFERIGLQTGTALLVGFLAVCLAEVVVGAMIWADAPRASFLALALLPVELAFWIGFALPFGPPLGIARTLLVLLL